MANDTAACMVIRVCHAYPHAAWQCQVELPVGATAARAVAASGFAAAFPGVDAWSVGVGVFGRKVDPGHVLCHGDRVEIYRSLVFDPMQSRRRRAAHRARRAPDGREPRIPESAD